MRLISGNGLGLTAILPTALTYGEKLPTDTDWPQWGGPRRDFRVLGANVASTWPPGGPRQLWRRALGEGYSSIAVVGKSLFTMYRKGDEEVVTNVDAVTGKSLWEYRYGAHIPAGMDMQNGPGPHATPLVLQGRVYSAGATGKLHCLDARSGKLLWSHDLVSEYRAALPQYGYSSSPIAYRNTIILPVGAKGAAIMAFDAATGVVVWARHDFPISNSSPVLIESGGVRHLVFFLAKQLVGVNPDRGDLLWSFPHTTQWDLNIVTAIWDGNGILFCSSGYDGGSRAVTLQRTEQQVTAKELWANRRLRIHFTNTLRIGEYIYGSSGDFGSAFLTAVHLKTGKVAWQTRGFGKANLIDAGGKVLLLDEDGVLSLVNLSPQGVTVLAKAPVLHNNAWSIPSLVGSTLYLRDRRDLVALDLR